MKSFHGKQSIKDNLLAQLRAHRDADEIVKGVYWQFGKGCAVGCTVHSSKHADYEKMYGIPRILATLEDGIFEALPDKEAKNWPIEFIEAIPVGVDLSKVWSKFAVFLLTDKKFGVINYTEISKQKILIKKLSDLYSENRKIEIAEWRTATFADGYPNISYYPVIYAAIYAAAAAIDDDCDEASSAASAAASAASCVDASASRNIRIAQSKKLIELLKKTGL